MRVVCTAGHVDHGKSTLVQALTGINPDRLKEEQAREMTIDLGFAWRTLPSGQVISLVDVPGHEAFIKNMLAGVGGIDGALLVIAADEGIMPQTREHLAILDLLQVKSGVVALTKTDLALEAGWLDLIQDEIRKTLRGTTLANAPIVPVSAKTRRGLDELVQVLDQILASIPDRSARGRPRLPIDRVFTISGFGTVVTGTLGDGHLTLGDEVEIAPRGLSGRIRGLQSHKEKIPEAAPGGRVAVNLAGLATEDLRRGDVVIHPNTYRPTTLLDVRIQWLASAPKPLRHNQELDLFVYSSEVSATVRLLESDTVGQGSQALAQLVLQAPVVVTKGDRFILRYPSPSWTVGGGLVIDPHPTARYRRRRAEVVERLQRLERGTPAELVMQFVAAHEWSDAAQLHKAVGLEEATTSAGVDELRAAGELRVNETDRVTYLVTRTGWNRTRDDMRLLLADYHRQFPLRGGMPREEFKSRLNLAPRVFEVALTQAALEDVLHANEKNVWLEGHRVQFDPAQQIRVNALLAQFERVPYTPPSTQEVEEAIGAEALNALIGEGRVERISPHVLMTREARKALQEWVVETIRTRGSITAAELRDHFDTSRKYAIAFLDYLDQKKITKRVGDARELR